MADKSTFVSRLKELAGELGRIPKRDEFVGACGGYEYLKAFNSFTALLHAAGFKGKDLKGERERPKKFKFIKKQLESFKVNELLLDDLFEKYGNPEILRVTAQPDTHMKNRDRAAVDAMLQFLADYQPHVHIIGGDMIDAEGVSHWPANELGPREFIPEIIEARAFLDALKSQLRTDSTILYIEGNHEDWIKQAMVAKMPEFFSGLDQLGLMPDLASLLELDRLGIPLVPVNEFLKIGKLHFTHGLYTGPSAAKKHLQLVKGNIYYFHTHDVLTYHEPSVHGMIEAASLGCLCRLDAPFLKGRPNNWVHAFGIFEIRRNGNYSFYCPRMFEGEFSFAGKRYKGRSR